MRGSEFVPDSIHLLYYHLQKVGLKRSGSYIDSPEWLKNKKATINPKNNDDNCFQYALTVALNHQNIGKTLKEYQKLNLLLISIIGKKQIFDHTGRRLEEWKKFEQKIKAIALNILFVPHNTKKYVMIMIIVMQKCLMITTKY